MRRDEEDVEDGTDGTPLTETFQKDNLCLACFAVLIYADRTTTPSETVPPSILILEMVQAEIDCFCFCF